jgi:chromosomal replication initiator protein
LDIKQIWQTTLGTLQAQTMRFDYDSWLKSTSLVAMNGDLVVIGTPNVNTKHVIEDRFISLIKRSLGDVLGYPVNVRVIIHANGTGTPSNGSPAAAASNGSPAAAAAPSDEIKPTPGAEISAPAAPMYRDSLPSSAFASNNNAIPLPGGENNGRSSILNPRYTFSSFIVGSSNRLAHAACVAVAEHPAQAYNPLFLYGGVGLGKTHLLQAIGNYALERNPEINILYVSSEKFTNDLINAIRRQQTEEFRIRYRNIDILLIDDIQFIAGKEGTQEEFFHTFNTLHGAGKQIVLSSDRPPKAILTLEERLRSRFEWGLIVDVQNPDLETRTAILRAKGESLQVPVASDVLDFLAHRIQSNIRELEGCLNRVVAYANLNRTPVTVEVAAAALADLLDTSRRKRITHEDIFREVAQHFSIDQRALKGRGRSRNVVLPRQIVMFLLREETDASLVEIGALLGGRDHTTVMHGINKINEEITTDGRLRNDVTTLRQRLYGENVASGR